MKLIPFSPACYHIFQQNTVNSIAKYCKLLGGPSRLFIARPLVMKNRLMANPPFVDDESHVATLPDAMDYGTAL